MKSKIKHLIIYICVLIFSFAYLCAGNIYTSRGLNIFSTEGSQLSVKAKVLEVTDTVETIDPYLAEAEIESEPNVEIRFDCKVLSGEHKGETLHAVQLIDGYMSGVTKPVKKGNTVYLYYSTDGDMYGNWLFADYDRLGKIIMLALFFFAALLIFGRIQGLNTIISLALTCASVIFVFIPAALTGKNIYFWAIITCVFSIITTLIIVYGVDKKSTAAALGCFSGIIIASVLTVIMDKAMRLSGFISEDCYNLSRLGVNIRAVIFGAVIIGAMGAIMDIAISISSSLFEVREKAESITASDIIHSGFTIGRDILGTMSNTLILAYIGSSLSVILVLVVYSATPLELLNRERVIVELMQSLIGIISILGTIPLTSVICGFLYGGKNEDKYLIVHKDEFSEEQ